METKPEKEKSPASLRWGVLRRALISSSKSSSECSHQIGVKKITRKTVRGFNLVPCRPVYDHSSEDFCSSLKSQNLAGPKDVCVCYELPVIKAPKLTMVQRREDCVDLDDFAASSKYNIDTTGLVCPWPSEDVLAYFCIKHSDIFRSKRVLELGSGYGLAGLAIAASTDANEVMISDGNPQVVDYIQRNINFNVGIFGNSKVNSMLLHWNQNQATDFLNSFDIIVASDCTFFKEFHESLAHTVKSLLKYSETSEAIFFSPKRGDSLFKFLDVIADFGLQFELVENYDDVVWNLHQKFLHGNDSSWPNYTKDHSYPFLVRITFSKQ
ncbi:calmodulin-lysine N-methyltransferase isoform X1 [Asparagus officinalis]|nr:calmodulin-lysine N-methyltransferase isoform X1 [Asparagus officinalis]